MGRPKKPEEKKKKKISITLDPELVERLKRWARIEDMSLSEYIENQLKDKVHWDIKEFGKFITLLNAYNDDKLDYPLEYKTVSVEFRLKNSKGGENLHKAVIKYAWCWDCPGPYATIKLYGWDDKKKEWFEMGEESTFSMDGEKLFNAILKIRRDFWLKLKTFRKEKKKRIKED